MAFNISSGALKDIFNFTVVPNPVLQVLMMKTITEGRYRLYVSDGMYKSGSTMIAMQLNHLVENKELDVNCMVRLDKYVCNTVKETKRVLVIFEMTILHSGASVGGVIGNPEPLVESANSVQEPARRQPEITNTNNNVPNRTSNGFSNQESVAKPSAQPGTHPIASLTPYQNKWTICARVTNKSNIRTWSNSRGEGRLFSLDLLDHSGEIRATAFNEQCDKFYNLIELNKVYYITQAQLKTANKQYSSLKNDYEMTFNNFTQVTLCQENTSIPAMQFQFVSIGDVETIDKDSIIDVIGICKTCDDLSTVVQKSTQKELHKRDLQLVDSSSKEIRLTLWGTQAENFNGNHQPIVAVKGVKVSDFNGKSLSVLSSSSLTVDPDIKEAHKLRAWYENCGSEMETVNLSNQTSGGGNSGMGSNFKTIGEAVLEKLGCNDHADYYTTKAVTSLIRKENCMYPACPSENCNKKVIDMNNGQYRCEKCQKEYDSFNWRLMLSANLVDGTDNVWVMMFQDQAETLLGCTSANLGEMKEANPDGFQEIFQAATFKEFIFKLRVKMETYNEENRLKTTVVNVQPLDCNEYNKRLIMEINKITGRH